MSDAECAAHIGAALGDGGGAGLLFGASAAAGEEVVFHQGPRAGAERAGEALGVVAAAGASAPDRHGDGGDQVDIGAGERRGGFLDERIGGAGDAGVFEGEDEASGDAVVEEGGAEAAECGGLFEAGAAEAFGTEPAAGAAEAVGARESASAAVAEDTADSAAGGAAGGECEVEGDVGDLSEAGAEPGEARGGWPVGGSVGWGHADQGTALRVAGGGGGVP